MATHGTVKPFNEQSDDWPTYIEHLQHYFIANDVLEVSKNCSILYTYSLRCNDVQADTQLSTGQLGFQVIRGYGETHQRL